MVKSITGIYGHNWHLHGLRVVAKTGNCVIKLKMSLSEAQNRSSAMLGSIPMHGLHKVHIECNLSHFELSENVQQMHKCKCKISNKHVYINQIIC